MIVGIVFPLVIAVLRPAVSTGESPIPSKEKDTFIIPAWCWLCLLVLACVPRLAQLTTLSTWPAWDEGLQCFDAMDLNRKWEWRLFFTFNQIPVFTFWCLALFFKIIQPSLQALWLFPAFISILTVGVAGLTRSLFPDRFVFLLLILISVNFPYLYTSKLCAWHVVVLFLTSLVLALLCVFLSVSSPRAASPSAFALGFVLGIGLFTAVAWPVVALCVLGAVAGFGRRKRNLTLKAWFFLTLPFAAAVGFFAFFSWKLKNGEYVKTVFAFASGTDWATMMNGGLHRVASLFWSGSPANCFGPLWGGMLNPILGAAFLGGLVKLVQNRRDGFSQWLLASLFLLILPGFLSRGFEIFRMTQAFPILIFIACLGLYDLFLSLSWPFSWKASFILALLAGSMALDFYHLEGPYHRLWGTPGPAWNRLKSNAYWRAYGILEKTQEKAGPGMVLLELRPDIHDQTLTPTTYPFNGCRNKGIPLASAHWAAFVVHPDFKPFLEKTFATGHWYWLDQDEMLGIVPLDASNLPTFLNWYEVDQQLQPVTNQIINLFPEESELPIIQRLLEIEQSLPPDRFLKSFLWEKVAYHRVADHDGAGAVEALREASQEGFPAAHFYYIQGVLLADMGKFSEAKIAFQKATQSPLDLSSARDNLGKIEKILASSH